MVSGGLTFIVVKSDFRHLSEESHAYDCESLSVEVEKYYCGQLLAGT